MNKYKKWQYNLIATEMVDILNKKGYDSHYADNINEAKKMILDMIPEGSSIAIGGSETLASMNMLETFRSEKYKFFERYNPPSGESITEVYRQSLLADFLVTSTNAITRNGELVNVDSSGNRVAGMIFGPKRVIIAAGANKVVDNLDEALKRLKKIAPMNAKRVGHKTPCVETGKCMDCELQACICNSIGIINHGRKFDGRISIIMIAEEAGF